VLGVGWQVINPAERGTVLTRSAEGDEGVQVCEHAGGSRRERGNRRSAPHVSGYDGALGADYDAAVEGNDADSVEVYVETDKTSLSVGNNDGKVLYVNGARGHLLGTHGE
jgi:hypothetical protein